MTAPQPPTCAHSDEDNMLQFLMNDPDKYDVFLAPEGTLTPYITSYISGVPTPGYLLPQVGAWSRACMSVGWAF